MESTV
jgi:hypothetical protein